MRKNILFLVLFSSFYFSSSFAENTVDEVLGEMGETYRGDDVPDGEAGRYYNPGAAAGADSIFPGSYSAKFKLDANFNASINNSCGDLNFYQNIDQEIARLEYKLQNLVKVGQNAIMTTISGMLSSFYEYLIMKINPTLAQLSLKEIDKYIEEFELKVKQCRDYEQDVQNGKNPLAEIVQVAVGDQWRYNIGMVNDGSISLEEATETLVEDAKKNGVLMSDGKRYGGEDQEPVNVTKSLVGSGMNLIVGRSDKATWETDFDTSAESIRNNPILQDFANTDELYDFVEDIYGSTEKVIDEDSVTGEQVSRTSGRGYAVKYAELRNELIDNLKKYVNREIDRPTFYRNTGVIIPPAEIQDVRLLPPYQKQMTIEELAQHHAINKIKDRLYFVKEAIKTGVHAPDMQQSDMRGVAEREYKELYYKILDDLAEISQRSYSY